jgi:glycosyltransferase involved in cell wall biosynthesis
MKIAFYSPYWQTMGGGEKYLFDIACCFPEDEIIFLSEDREVLRKAEERFDFNPKNIKNITDFKKENGKIDKNIVRHMDLFFYQCDGSLFFGPAKKNILLIQSPAHTPKFSWLNKLKSLTWQKIVCNSDFTAHFIRQKLLMNPVLLNPAILPMPPLLKKNVILAVGRFFPHLHSKKQEVLIEVFKQMNPESYRLILVGAVAESDRDYLNKLKEQAKDYPIDFYENASLSKIKELYGEAKIFWHAAGFGEDLVRFPERAEHFGISTIEAISAGCYPLVFKAGGQIGILGTHDEFYWMTKEELMSKTMEAINNEKLLISNLEKIKNIPRQYSFENFKKKLHEIIK